MAFSSQNLNTLICAIAASPLRKQAERDRGTVGDTHRVGETRVDWRRLRSIGGKEIRKLNGGRADSPVFAVLRRVLREARVVARKEGFTTRVRLDLPARR